MKIPGFRLTFLLFFALVWGQGAVAAGSWTTWARVVGQAESEDARQNAIAQLKRDKNLNTRLIKALETPNRPLALDVISALNIQELVPELTSRVEKDEDGFLTLNLNTLLNEENKDSILKKYTELLGPGRSAKVSAGAIVAMLEPMGRVGKTLPRAALKTLSSHPYPEVRASVLYYLRMLAIKHDRRDNNAVIVQALSAEEFQLRLQATSILAEIADAGKNVPMNRAELHNRCKRESHSNVRNQCLAILNPPKGSQ